MKKVLIVVNIYDKIEVVLLQGRYKNIVNAVFFYNVLLEYVLLHNKHDIFL